MGSTSLGTPELLWGAGAPPWVIQVRPQGTQARKHFPGGPMHLLLALKHLTMDALKNSPTPQKHLLGEVRILPKAPNHLPWAPKYILQASLLLHPNPSLHYPKASPLRKEASPWRTQAPPWERVASTVGTQLCKRGTQEHPCSTQASP